MSDEIKDPRIFVGWNNGSYVNSMAEDFQKSLLELVDRFGPPDTVEYRIEWGIVEEF